MPLDSLLKTVQWLGFWTLTFPISVRLPSVPSNPTLAAVWNYLAVASKIQMPGPHSQRLWTQAFQPLILPALRPHQDTFSPNQSGPNWSNKFFVYPTSLILSLLLSPANTSQGNTHYSLSIQITEIWGNTMKLLTFRRASTAAPPFFYSILMTSHQIHSFILQVSQPITTKLNPMHYLSARLHQ